MNILVGDNSDAAAVWVFVLLNFPFTAAPSRAYGAVLRVADPRLGRMQVFFVQNLLF